MLTVKDAPSPNFDARRGPPDMLVLHYTGMRTADEAIARLRDPEAKVSAHYVVDEDGSILRLVAEERRAWHAGRGAWQGETDCNAASIGIEIVNPGHEFGYRDFPGGQIDAVIGLISDIRTRWTIPDARIIGHSDLAPERKQDPGELFPWKRLAAVGHGLWFEPAPERIAALGAPLAVGDEGLGVIVLRAGLHRLGYGLTPGGEYDEATRLTIEAFQRHWRPARVDGIADGETRATLMGVLQLATAESVTGVLN
ncbi:MAG: N-acetylmuramoyl-L-alanine amidase [Alphaproteobacteria bacterium]|nr:N-acetylmuramoyl-L-alanine amidase [Alphaproteobacteria bacterium]MBU2042190.1 N-acetylmuramoyl-L-alanine amidase [Alphaproteobacteria bacterium]MBU2125626.1 N-acetylmuramoyl-L-alanine amidase [Alphaproteobacteria bacterium]MBU2208381.1 N-acetylmuramoyl-L-alanine amidase [Alphaproteobacteria bacterium]MBU2290465.1 N-acetylmuramoyl-L-alanine amidase [Alphaproteobacteria bacterium]